MVTEKIDVVPEVNPPPNSATDGAVSTATEVIDPAPPVEPEPPVAPAVPSYQGTRIEGRSTDEANAYIQLLERTVQDQKDRITTTPAAPTPPPAPAEPEVNFFDNPNEVLRREVERAVAPINQQIQDFRAQAQSANVWTQIEQEIPDFDQYRPLVDQLIEGHGYKAADLNVNLLRNLYYTAVGWNNRHGGNNVNQPTPPPTPAAPQAHIPQHNPSSAPLAPPAGAAAGLRELTENERHLAREWKMSHEEFLRLQDENLELEGFDNG